MGPLASESFANTAAHAAATFDSEGRTKGTATPSTGTIRYDASAKSYTLMTGDGSITFGPSDIDPVNSNAAAIVYSRTKGNTTDTLTITRPGATGILTYKYVGGAFWQHSVVEKTSGSGTIDAFAYGVATPGGAVPKTGVGAYAVDLIGAETGADIVSPLSGAGIASIDFTTGTVIISGTMNLAMLGGQTGPFQGTGKMGSGPDFSSSFSFDDFGVFSGSLKGKLFGPRAEEIGATFAVEEGRGGQGRVAVGALIGRRSDQPANTSFNANGRLDNSQLFSTAEAKLTFTSATGARNNDVGGAFAGQAAATGGLLIQYNAADESYSLVAPDRSIAFDVYGRSRPAQPTGSETLRQIEGDGYVGAGSWWSEQTAANGNPPFSYRLSHFVYGMPTAAADMIRTGKAGYALRFAGDAADNDYKNLMIIGGTGDLVADFASGKLNLKGSLGFYEDYVMSGRVRENATGSLSGSGTISSTANQFSGSLSFDGIGNYAGTFSGQFYGPAAEQLGGVFTASDGANRAAGTFTGKQDSSILDAEQTLEGLKTPTTFTAFTAHDVYTKEHPIDYDPATGKYTLSLDNPFGSPVPVPFEFSQQDIVAAKSDASRTWYERGGDRAVSGYLFKPGATNPVLALTYASFGDLIATYTMGASSIPQHHYLIFGIPTPPTLLPRSGSGSYTGIARGMAIAPPMEYNGPASGISRLIADFAAGTTDFSLQLQADNPARSPIGNFTMTGTIANNGFFGGSGDGTFRGNFFGPKADEFGAVWNVMKDVEGGRVSVNGAAVGKRD